MAVYYDDLFEDEVANDGDPHRKIQMIMESAAAILEEKKTLETFFKLDVLNIEHVQGSRWNSSKWMVIEPTDCMKQCHRGNELCLCRMFCRGDRECLDKCQSDACPQSEDKCKVCDPKKSYECQKKCHEMDRTIWTMDDTQRYFLMAIMLTVTLHYKYFIYLRNILMLIQFSIVWDLGRIAKSSPHDANLYVFITGSQSTGHRGFAFHDPEKLGMGNVCDYERTYRIPIVQYVEDLRGSNAPGNGIQCQNGAVCTGQVRYVYKSNTKEHQK